MSLINKENAAEVQNLETFAAKHYSAEKAEQIFRTAEKDSYYLDSEEVRRFPERMMEYGFANPMQFEKLLKMVWKEDSEMRELIPTVKVATFKMKDQYDSKFKDLSLYNYTL